MILVDEEINVHQNLFHYIDTIFSIVIKQHADKAPVILHDIDNPSESLLSTL